MHPAHQALAAMPPERLRRLALTARKQLRNQALDRARLQGRLVGFATTAGGAAIAGYMMGKAMSDREANVVAIEAGQMEDPTKFLGFLDKDAAIGFGLTATGILVQSFTKQTMLGEALEGLGLGAFGYWVGSRAQEFGYEAGQQAIAA